MQRSIALKRVCAFILALPSIHLIGFSQQDPHGYIPVRVGHNLQQWLPANKIPLNIQTCANNAPGGYANHQCLVTINRDLPISPPLLLLPGGTEVFIELDGPHWDEMISFNNAVVNAGPEDIAADTLKSIVTPLSNLVSSALNTNLVHGEAEMASRDETAKTDTTSATDAQILAEQEAAKRAFESAIVLIQNATTKLNCIESYKLTIKEDGDPVCDATSLIDNITLKDSITKLLPELQNAMQATLPAAELGAADADIKTKITRCAAAAKPDGCFDLLDKDQTLETILNNELTTLQTAQGTILQAYLLLKSWPLAHNDHKVAFKTVLDKNNTGTITITGTEFITKTVTTVATITFSTVATRFVLSSGLMYTTTPFRNYAIGDEIIGGVVQTTATTTTSSSGVVTTTVTPVQIVSKTLSNPSIDFPVVLLSYIIPGMSRWTWENNCRNHCEFLFSGGAGYNLAAKAADLTAGPSFEFGGFLVTFGAVGARQNRLLDGVYVNQTNFGGNYPSSLQTGTHWTVGGGIALTYTIPTP